ncbi:MAG: methyltransferase [Ghiorsea sp.]
MSDSPVLNLLYQAALDQDVLEIAILNAEFHPLLLEIKAQASHLTLVQHFKPTINALQCITTDVSTQLEGQFPLILLIPSKDKQQSLAWMALAMAHLCEGGKLLLACENQYGAKSYESALKKLTGQVNSTSKAKCRVFSALKTVDLNSALQQAWLQAAMPKYLESHGLLAQPGLFSWKTADIGSLLLLESLPTSLSGVGMDLCCGYGLLAASILNHQQDIQHLHLVEADALALACAQVNTAGHEHVHYHHLDAQTEPLPKKTDWLVCNPPFHRGQVRDVELGKAIVVRACHALKAGGDLYLVANRQLPYEHVLKEHLSSVETWIERDGFKVLHGKR